MANPKIKKALSLRGGASQGLVYFRLLKEIYNKNIIFENLSGASAGGIFAACLACIRHPKRIFELFKALRGDRVMKWACEAETGYTNNGESIKPLGRIGRIIGLMLFRRIPIGSMRRAFKKHLSWERAKSMGVKRLCIGVVKQKDVIKVLGKEFFQELKKDGFRDMLDGDGTDDIKKPSIGLIHNLPMYFFCNDGIYRKYYNQVPVKISSKVTPLWKVVLATFNNPILPPVKLKFDKWYREICFDGGIANNWANTIWEDKDFIQASCTPLPGKCTGNEMGIWGINTLYYNENRPAKAYYIKTTSQFKGFFGFYDGNIEEYYKEEPTDILK